MKAALWEAFLEQAQPDVSQRNALRKIACQWAHGRLGRPFILTGPGPTGKTTFEAVLVAATKGRIADPIATSNLHPHRLPSGSAVVAFDQMVSRASMDPLLARKIIANELSGVRDWLLL